MHRRALQALTLGYAALNGGAVAALLVDSWIAYGAGALAGTVLAAAVLSGIDAAERIDRLDVAAAGTVLPLGWFWPAITHASSAIDLFVSPWGAGAAASVVWLCCVVLAHEVRYRARLDAAETIRSFGARPAPRNRRHLHLVVGAYLVLVVGISVGIVVFSDADPMPTLVWVPAQVPIWLAVLQNVDNREVQITDVGLRVQRTFHDWTSISGVELTDEAVRFERTSRWRSAFTFDREDVDDPAAVVAAAREFC